MALLLCGPAQYGMTPLHWAAFNGRLEVVRLLLDSGADKEATNQVRTPCATAAARCVGARRVQRSAALPVTTDARRVAGCGVALTPWPLVGRTEAWRCFVAVARRPAQRRCRLPRRLASWRLCGCCWSAARTRRPKTRCAAHAPLPRLAASACAAAPSWPGAARLLFGSVSSALPATTDARRVVGCGVASAARPHALAACWPH
jgi:hypothetical protein